MSGPIRKKIGPLTSHLSKRITGLQAYTVPADGGTQDLLEELIDDLNSDLSRIDDWTSSLCTFDQQWQMLLNDDPDGIEATAFETFTKVNNYPELIIKGQEKVTELQNKRSKLVRVLNKLKKEAGDEPIDIEFFTPERSIERRPMRPESSSSIVASSQLPTLGLRHFSGDFKEWKSWSNWFTVTFRRQRIDKLRMFMYLHSCITDGSLAASIIAPFDITEANFDAAWKALESQCGNEKRIMLAHWDTVINLPAIKSDSAPISSIRKNFNDMSLALFQLKQSGEDIEGRSIYGNLQRKWPLKITERLLDREECSPSWSTTAMMQALDDIIRRQEELQMLCGPKELSKFSKEKQNKPNESTSSATSALATSIEPSKKSKNGTNNGSKNAKNDQKRGEKSLVQPPYCVLHELEGHWTSDCKVHGGSEESIKNQLVAQGRCQNCTSKNHSSCSKDIYCKACRKKGHHRIFHDVVTKSKITKANAVQEVHFGTFSVLNSASEISGNKRKMLYVVEGMVSNPRHPEKLQKVTIFLDSGAEQSFCSQDLANKLQLKGPKENLRVSTFGSDKIMSVTSQLVKLGFKIFDGSYVTFDLKSIPYMIKPIWTVLASEIDTNDKFLTPKMHQPDVLLGIDYYNDVVLSIKPTRMRSQFWLQPTIFGPTVGGKGYVSIIGNEESTEAENMIGIYCLATPHLEKGLEPSLEELVRTQYEIDKLGITEPTETTNDDAQAVEILQKNIRVDESGRIEVPLLWRRDTTKVPMNRGLAYGRFLTEVKKLKAAGNIEKYDQIIKEYIELGIVEKVSDPSQAEGFVSYLPHHGITKISSNTTKLRIVNDGSATIGNAKSLNDHMYRGPPLIPDAAGFLMRFRKHILALIFDLEKAFLNLSVRKIDRDVLRFFWLIDVNQPLTAETSWFSATSH